MVAGTFYLFTRIDLEKKYTTILLLIKIRFFIILAFMYSFDKDKFQTKNLRKSGFLNKKVEVILYSIKQGRKRPLDTPKRMIERREREGEREIER